MGLDDGIPLALQPLQAGQSVPDRFVVARSCLDHEPLLERIDLGLERVGE